RNRGQERRLTAPKVDAGARTRRAELAGATVTILTPSKLLAHHHAQKTRLALAARCGRRDARMHRGRQRTLELCQRAHRSPAFATFTRGQSPTTTEWDRERRRVLEE